MRLGLNLGYWDAGSDPAEDLAVVRHAERLGYSVVWAAEAYGSDAATVLGWLAARTSRIELGSAVFQIPARTPAMTAMTAATLDTLSAGRFRLGLGVSGPQVSEGWHGVRFDRPLGRTREYVEIVRMALARHRVRHDGRHYQLPLPDGPGKALVLTLHPVRELIPLYLAAVGPKNVELAGEIAEGWLAVFFSPAHAGEQLAGVRIGRQRAGRTLAGFDIAVTAPIVVSDGTDSDAALAACADAVRPYCALYLGGMGSRTRNFYNQLAVRMGFGEAAAAVRDHWFARDHAGAAAAVPFGFVDQTSLLGSPDRIADRLRAFAAAGVTTLSLTLLTGPLERRLATLQVAARALESV